MAKDPKSGLAEASALLDHVLTVPFTWREEIVPGGTRGFIGTAPGHWRCAVGMSASGAHGGAIARGPVIVLLGAELAAKLWKLASEAIAQQDPTTTVAIVAQYPACLYCGRPVEEVRARDLRPPKAGDLSGCEGCGGVAIFTGRGWETRTALPEEIERAMVAGNLSEPDRDLVRQFMSAHAAIKGGTRS